MFIIFEHSSLRAAADIGCIRMVARSGSGCSMPRRNLCGARSVDKCRTQRPGVEANVVPQPMGTGAWGECGRESARRFEGVGNWKGALSGGGSMPAISKARSSIFLVAEMVSGAFFSCFLPSLIDSHMLHGCCPSKVFFAPAMTDPSCVV